MLPCPTWDQGARHIAHCGFLLSGRVIPSITSIKCATGLLPQFSSSELTMDECRSRHIGLTGARSCTRPQVGVSVDGNCGSVRTNNNHHHPTRYDGSRKVAGVVTGELALFTCAALRCVLAATFICAVALCQSTMPAPLAKAVSFALADEVFWYETLPARGTIYRPGTDIQTFVLRDPNDVVMFMPAIRLAVSFKQRGDAYLSQLVLPIEPDCCWGSGP